MRKKIYKLFSNENKHPIFEVKVSFFFYISVLLLSCFVAFLWAGFTSDRLNDFAVNMAARNLSRYVNVTRVQHALLTEQTNTLAVNLAREVRQTMNNPEVCNANLAEVLAHSTLFYNIGVVDAHGNILCGALPLRDDEKRLNVSDKVFFKKAVETKVFAVGEYQIGLITKQPTLHFGYPILDKAGQVVAVIGFSLKLEYLAPLIAKADLPEGSTILVSDRNGKILFAYPNNNSSGMFGFSTELVNAILTREKNNTILTDSNNQEWIFGFTPLNSDTDQDVVVALGIPKRNILKNVEVLNLGKWAFIGITFIVLSSAGLLEVVRVNKRKK